MDYFETVKWAEREHKKWMDSVADFEGDPTLEDEIKGDDDDTEDIEESD